MKQTVVAYTHLEFGLRSLTLLGFSVKHVTILVQPYAVLRLW